MDKAPFEVASNLKTEIIDLCGRMHGAEYLLLHRIHQLDEIEDWAGTTPSCAHWLVWRCGMDIVTAREKVRVSHALAGLPLLDERFRSGELSYSKVRAITRIADADSEAEWIDTALRHTAAQLERIVRQHRQTTTLGGPDGALAAWTHRHLDYRVQGDGSLSFEGRVPAEVGAMLMQALDRALEWMDQDAREPSTPDHASAEASSHSACCGVGGHSHGDLGAVDHARGGDDGAGADASPADVVRHEACGNDSAESSRAIAVAAVAAAAERPSLTARRADALGLLAERFLAVAPEAEDGLQTADRYLLTIHAPVTALPFRAQVDPTDPPRVEQGSVLSSETVRRIGCDAALVRVLESGGGEPLDVGRKTRVIPPAIRRALKRRDGGCRFPGCGRTKFVDGHHIEHWADGGATHLENLVSVCRHHHGLLHEGGYSVVKRGGQFHFFGADGLRVPEVNDHLLPEELEAELGQGVVLRGSAFGAGVSFGAGFGSAAAPAWRLARARGFNRTASRQRSDWEAFVTALQR